MKCYYSRVVLEHAVTYLQWRRELDTLLIGESHVILWRTTNAAVQWLSKEQVQPQCNYESEGKQKQLT